MKRNHKIGEGILLGAVLCALLIGMYAVSATRRPAAVVLQPIHEVDVVITPEPLININTAAAEEIASLNGIGEVIAERIVARREEKGPFESVEELTEISGIGEAKLDAIRDRICLN